MVGMGVVHGARENVASVNFVNFGNGVVEFMFPNSRLARHPGLDPGSRFFFFFFFGAMEWPRRGQSPRRRTALFAPPAGRASCGSVELRSTLPGASYNVASIARAA